MSADVRANSFQVVPLKTQEYFQWECVCIVKFGLQKILEKDVVTGYYRTGTENHEKLDIPNGTA